MGLWSASCRSYLGAARRALLAYRLFLTCRLRGAATDLVRHAQAPSSHRAPPRRRTVEARPIDQSHARAGIVSGLWRYPVKSMAGEALASADLSWAGLAGDRRWAFVRPDSEDSGLPWHTIREFPQMSRYVALLGEPARPDRSRVLVQTPD